MSQPATAFIEELTWDQARKDILKVNPELVHIIDGISPDKKHTLFKARYPYGSEILKRAKLYVPHKNGKLLAIDDPELDPRVRECLSYNLLSNPVAMVLTNTLELCLPLEDRIIPMNNLVHPGKIFGTYRILTHNKISHQPSFIWDMTAGARSIFMLAKISDTEKHKKLRKNFALTVDTPRTSMDHWSVFKEIANSKDFPSPWHTDLIFFSENWFKHLDDKRWMPLNYYLYQSVWAGGDFWRNVFFWDIVFSLIQKNIHFRPSAYIADTVKYLFAISVGESLGFIPANDDTTAPIQEIQRIYTDIYNIKQAPIIMQPSVLSPNDPNGRPVYYSLRFPSAMELGGKSRTRDNFTNDIFEIKSLLNQYTKKIRYGNFNLEHTPFYEYLKNIAYEYIHNDINIDAIKNSDTVPISDKSFMSPTYCQNKLFPSTSSFFRGCIKIMYKS